MDPYIPPGFDVAQAFFNAAHKDIVLDGRIRAVIAAYEKALEDPNFKAPSFLHAALEALRRA